MPITTKRAGTRAIPARAKTVDADRDVSIRAMDNLRRVVRALSTSSRGVSSRGLSGAQLFVLRQIAKLPSLSLRELADRTLTGQSTVSEVVTRLVERGLVTRAASATDARRAELTLTARGHRAIAGTEPTAQERLADGLATLPRARRTALADALDAWLAAAGLADVAAKMFFDGHADARIPAPRAGRVARAGRRA
ncbi:MAG TPA: MarR family transcriptional regulator [Gemmatimonadaceae bacterium]|nr:MarR family transcriptional regulator [Gemmatimonadaceae bacterium]